mgnify:CR=1 FL=1
MVPLIVVALVIAVLVVVGVVLTASRGSAPSTPPPAAVACGWDLTSSAGQRANSEHLTATMQWLADHPGGVAPAPTSAYWRGDCPMPSGGPVPPPDDEHEAPDEENVLQSP